MWPRSHPLISCRLPVVFCGTAASDAIKACCYLFFSYSSVSKASPPEPKEPACPPLCACWFPCLFSFFTQQVLTSEGAFCPREGEEPPPPPRSQSLDVMEWTQTSVGGLSMSPRPLSRGGWVTEAVFVLALIMSTANMSAYTVKGGFNSDYCFFFVFWKMGKALRRH